MTNKPTNNRGPLAAVGVGAVLVVCCALPLLLTAGAVGALGGLLGNPWLLAAATVLAAVVLAVTVTRVRHRTATSSNDSSPQGREDCCPPLRRDHRAATHPANK